MGGCWWAGKQNEDDGGEREEEEERRDEVGMGDIKTGSLFSYPRHTVGGRESG